MLYLTIEAPIIAFMAPPVVFHNPLYPFSGVPFERPPFEDLEEFMVDLSEDFRCHDTAVVVCPSGYLFV